MSRHTIPAVSIIIPAYNAARHIGEALEGVMEQTCQDFEIIVVDDGSTDETMQLASKWGDKVRCVRKANEGTASARNLGIRLVRGQYVAFLDADDIWLPKKLQRQLELLKDDPELMWCYGNALFFDTETSRFLYTQSQIQKQLRGDVLRPLLLSNFIPVSTVVVKRSAFDVVGFFDESWPTCEDRDMWLRLAARYPVGYIREPLVKYRLHHKQKTKTTRRGQLLHERLDVIQAAVRREPERLADLYSLAASNVHSNIGWDWFEVGYRTVAQRHFWQAIRIHPASARAWIYWWASFVPQPLLRQMIRLLRFVRKFL